MRRRQRLPRAQLRGLLGARRCRLRGCYGRAAVVAPSFVVATNASSQRRGESVPGRYKPGALGAESLPGKWLTCRRPYREFNDLCKFLSLASFFVGLTKAENPSVVGEHFSYSATMKARRRWGTFFASHWFKSRSIRFRCGVSSCVSIALQFCRNFLEFVLANKPD